MQERRSKCLSSSAMVLPVFLDKRHWKQNDSSSVSQQQSRSKDLQFLCINRHQIHDFSGCRLPLRIWWQHQRLNKEHKHTVDFENQLTEVSQPRTKLCRMDILFHFSWEKLKQALSVFLPSGTRRWWQLSWCAYPQCSWCWSDGAWRDSQTQTRRTSPRRTDTPATQTGCCSPQKRLEHWNEQCHFLKVTRVKHTHNFAGDYFNARNLGKNPICRGTK